MNTPLVECVPNFSEGRDTAKIRALTDAIGSAGGVHVLDVHSDPDHNRTVITFAGGPDAVVEAAVRGAGTAVELIDLNQHRGVHPRIGAVDVLPFVPLAGVSIDECSALAVMAGEQIWLRHHLPVYLYEAAARHPDRISLAGIRRGEFEGLREEAPRNPDRLPDIGGPGLHTTAGAVAVGARKLLIAYNIQLNTSEVAIARRIAGAIRTSAGGLAHVKAMGVYLATQTSAQVSMNLTDFEVTPPYVVFRTVQREAAKLGVGVLSSEFVGLVPKQALAGHHDLRLAGFNENRILENRLKALRE